MENQSKSSWKNLPNISNQQRNDWKMILLKAEKDQNFRNDLQKNFDKAVSMLGIDVYLPLKGRVVIAKDTSELHQPTCRADKLSDNDMEKILGGVLGVEFVDGSVIGIEIPDAGDITKTLRHPVHSR
jgi:hypothetical protein